MIRRFTRDRNFLLKYYAASTLLSIGALCWLRPPFPGLWALCLAPLVIASFTGVVLANVLAVALCVLRYGHTLTAWHLLLIPLGIYVGMLNVPVIHNCAHGNFRPRWINRLLGELCSLHLLSGFPGFTILHLLHHRHADDPVLDPHPNLDLTYWQYLNGLKRSLGNAFRAFYVKTWGDDRGWRATRALLAVNRVLRALILLALFGPVGFALFYVPSILANQLTYAHINYYTHRRRPDGTVEILNLDYRWLNRWLLGIYHHRTHHRHAGLFDPSRPPLILQASSGSSGAPPKRIRRTPEDLASLHAIVLKAWSRLYREPPERVALLGGISHGQAARHFRTGGTVFESFRPEERVRLKAFDPDFLSCYPSFAREIVADRDLALPSLKAMKLGGERVFRADLEKIAARFPGLPVIEQLGSAEMPAIAVGLYRSPADPRRLELQTQRFTFRLAPHGEWQPLVVRDDFPDLRHPYRGFYATGDEVRLEGDAIADVRRAGDPAHAYFEAVELWLRAGCVNVQVVPGRGELRYTGTGLPPRVRVGERELATRPEAPRRIPRSNKLLIISNI